MARGTSAGAFMLAHPQAIRHMALLHAALYGRPPLQPAYSRRSQSAVRRDTSYSFLAAAAHSTTPMGGNSMDWKVFWLEIARPAGLTLLALCAVAGLLAVLSPRLFRRAVDVANRRVDSNRLLALFDRQYDIDRFLLPHARLLGALVLLSAAFLVFVLAR